MGYEGSEQYRVLLDAIKQVVVRSGKQMVFDEVSSNQLAAKDHFIFQEKDIKDTIVLNPLLERTSMAIKSEVPEVSEDTT